MIEERVFIYIYIYIYIYTHTTIQGVRKLMVQTLSVGINTQNNDFFKN